MREVEIVDPEISDAEWNEDGSVTVSVSCMQAATVTAAVYTGDGQFLGLAQQPVTGQTVTLTNLPDGDLCKVFLTSTDHAPLCPVKPAK